MPDQQRINLNELRQRFDHSSEPCEGQCVFSAEQGITRSTMLALIEAVEAANDYLTSGRYDRRERLRLALHRFDFGDT